MEPPVVSVHIITYNQVRYIAEAIEGALRQRTSFKVEIIVGDDGSSDGTREVVLAYQRRYPEQVRAILSDQNVGPCENSKRVKADCRGKYFAICDGDDYWTDCHKLEKQVAFLEANREYAMCCHDVEIVVDGVPKTSRYVEFAGDTLGFEDVVRGHFIPTLSIVCRRDLLTPVPPWYYECISGDIAMTLMLLDRGSGYYLHEKMGVKRDNPGGISLDPHRAAASTESFLRTYKMMYRDMRGRHRMILRWKIARLSLKLAKQNLKANRFARFVKCSLDGLLYDRSVISDITRKRLGLSHET